MSGFAFVLLLFSTPAQAFVSNCVTYDVKSSMPDELISQDFIKCMHQGDRLYFDGAIDENLIDEFKIYATQPIKTLYLNSGGGHIEAAFKLAAYIREHKIVTVVRKGARCSSACTLLFQAGVQRFAHPTARFLYHGARYLMITTKQKEFVMECEKNPNPDCIGFVNTKQKELSNLTHELFDLYELYGASALLRSDYMSLPMDPNWLESGNYIKIADWRPSVQELMGYGVVTDLQTNEILNIN